MDTGSNCHWRVLTRGSPLLTARVLSCLHCSDSGLLCVFRPAQARAAQVTRCLASAVAPRWGCSLSPPPSQSLGFLGVQRASVPCACVYSGELISVCNPPGECRLPIIPRSLLAVWYQMLLWGRLPPSGSGCPRLPVSGGRWAGPQPASSAQCFVL